MNSITSRLAAICRKFFSRDTHILIRIFVCIAVFFVLFWLVLRFSPYSAVKIFLSRPDSVRYYDRNGLLLQITPLAGGLRREMPLEIPAELKEVFVFSEDRRFYRHPGVDILSLVRAMYQNVTQRRRVSGASTITMQLSRIIADNAKPVTNAGRRQTLWSKTCEIFNALRLEARFSKDEILQMYLNSLPFGYNTEGVASAARNFFSSELSMLSPSQIFCLAVIPRRPSLYNPLDNPQTCIGAASVLQAKFAESGRNKNLSPLFSQVNEDDWKFAASSARRFEYPFELPHLIRYVNAQVVSGTNKKSQVYLSIDLALQRRLENTIAGNVERFTSSRITNGSGIVIDNETGEILAWVGSIDFFNTEDSGQIDGVLALNQPGSAMKPFLYAMALENGFKPTDVIADVRMTFGETELYVPRNFDDRFHGPMLFRSALASSLNIPAVYLLTQLNELNFNDLLFSLGFDSLEKSTEDPGLGLALGNAPVSLLELVRAFSVFTRDGVYLPLTWELSSPQAEALPAGKQVYSADTARLICSFLSDSSARSLAFGYSGNFRTPFPSIFKTGTANQHQSIVALGSSQRYSAGVWMGNFTGETVIGRTGSSVPAVIVRDFLILLEGHHGRSNPDFPAPENWELKRVCAVSGMIPTEACLSVINEYVSPFEEREYCTWHQFVNGQTITVFPAEYQAWFNTFTRQGSLDYASRPLEIVNPRDGFSYLTSPGIGIDEIRVEVIGGGHDELHVTHNGMTFYKDRPFVFFIPRITGENTLYVKNGEEEDVVSFTVE